MPTHFFRTQVFSAILVFSSLKLLLSSLGSSEDEEEEEDLSRNKIVQLATK